jgi:hypothetical protein
VTAASLFGIWPEEKPKPLHVVVPRGTRPLQRDGVVVHTTVTHFEPVRPRGVLATPVPRTLRDIAATETLADSAFALRAARRAEIVTPAQLEAEIAVGGPGSKRLREAFEVDEAYGLKSESWLEDHALPALARSSLPRFETQYPIQLSAEHTVRPDVAWPEAKLALEWLGVKWHSSGVAVAKDELKHGELETAGWHVEYAGSEALAGAPFRVLVTRLHRLHAERMSATV